VKVRALLLEQILKQITMAKKMNKDRQLQYYAKISGALNEIFNPESEFYIDIQSEDFYANDFFHTLATRVPQLVFAKLISQQLDPLGFNHAMNRLITQDIQDGKK
jgi:hypothetical protein